MNERHDPTEQKALESLIGAILHQFGASEMVSDQEIEEFLSQGYSLSEEQQIALSKLGDNPLEWITNKRDDAGMVNIIRDETVELAGMYRHSSDEKLDCETKKLIEEKRRQIIAKIRRKRKDLERPRD